MAFLLLFIFSLCQECIENNFQGHNLIHIADNFFSLSRGRWNENLTNSMLSIINWHIVFLIIFWYHQEAIDVIFKAMIKSILITIFWAFVKKSIFEYCRIFMEVGNPISQWIEIMEIHGIPLIPCKEISKKKEIKKRRHIHEDII